MNSFKIKNWVVQTFPNEKLTNRPNVELDECNKLCIHDFSSWDHLGIGQSVCFKKLVFSRWANDPFDDIKWIKFDYKVVRAH